MKHLFHSGAIAVCATLMLAAVPSRAGQAASASPRSAQNGILGYLDPKTGAFRPVPLAPSDDAEMAAAAAAPTTGKFVFSLTIEIASSLPTSDTIQCNASASTSEQNSSTFAISEFLEQASVVATRSGSTAKCTVTIPYSWGLTAPASDSVQLSFTITAQSTGTAPVVGRYSTQSLPSIKVPSNGATTTETIKATI